MSMLGKRAVSRALVIGGLMFLLVGCSGGANRGGAAREFQVTSRQFAYDPPEIRVKKGERVRLHVTSTDVTHGFAIAEYGINQQTPPGRTVTVEFVADKPGRFVIYCTVFCGTGHSEHKGVLIVEE